MIYCEIWEKTVDSSFSSPSDSNSTLEHSKKVFTHQVVGKLFGGHALFWLMPKNEFFCSKVFSWHVGAQNDRLVPLFLNIFVWSRTDKAFSSYGAEREFAREISRKFRTSNFWVQNKVIYMQKKRNFMLINIKLVSSKSDEIWRSYRKK